MYSTIEEFIESINTWDIYLFHWKINTPQKHFQIFLNKKIDLNSKIIFASVTTKNINDRLEYIRKTWFDLETLVIVKVWEIDFLKVDSCFHCNDLMPYNKTELYSYYKSWSFKYIWNIPEHILEKIYLWISKSTMVSRNDKNLIFQE